MSGRIRVPTLRSAPELRLGFWFHPERADRSERFFDYITRCDFNNNAKPFCDWIQPCESDDGSWIRSKHATPTLGTGPEKDYPDGGGYFLYQEASNLVPSQLIRLESVEFTASGEICIDFWYHMLGLETQNELKVVIQENLTERDVWRRNGNQGPSWLYGSRTVHFPRSSNIKVIFEAIRGQTDNGDIAIDNVAIRRGNCGSGGYYIYIEGNDGRAGDRAQLVSAPCAERGARCMRFWYHMYGVARHMALNVYQVESGTAVLKWSDSGNKGNRWIEGQVSLHLSGDSQILLEAVRGSDYRSDVAVDDISFHVGCCEETSCIVQGDPHYLTFDDQAHDFMGTCTYTLSKLCSTSSGLPYFNVEAANEHRGRNPYVSYVRQVNVEVSSHRITLGKGRVVKVDGEEAVLPVSVSPGVVVALTGQYVVITTSFGLRVKFNGKHRAEVTLSSLFKGKVCGMCGNYNEDRRDDFLNPDGIMEPDSVSLGNSWQSGNDTRCTPDVGIRPDCSEDEKRIIESKHYCGIIKESDGPFKGCHSKVDPEAYFADCVYDLCALGTEQEALCSSLESYGDACQSEGARVEAWRNETFCPVNCGANSHYEQCGSACPATCVSPSAPSRCLKPCVEGCVCDSGYLLYNDRCVPEEKCGCWYEGKHYPVGSELWTDDTCSRKCRCPSAGSKMVCWDSTCSKDSYCGVVNGVPGCYPYTYGICRVHNDPHYNTFDKATLHFMGSCTYTIAKSCGNSSSLPYFNIETKNENRGDARVSYVQKVHVTVHGHSVWIVKGESQRVLVDDVWETLPVQRGKGALSVSRSGRYVVLTTDFGLYVSYDTDHSVEVKVPSTYFNQVCGMCGNYNGIWQDDYMKPDGSQAKDVNELGNSWKVPPDEPGCDPIEPGVCLPADEERYRGDDFCGLITSQQGPFVNCHSVINTNGFFESCVVEMCLTDGDQGALCRTLQIYSDACQRAGVTIVPWRNSTFCGIVCAANSHYNVCASACPATCTDRFASENCSKPCVEDCECNHGFVLSGSLCVSVENCGCTHKNKYYEKGAMFWEDGCREKCRCTGNDRIVCEPANCGPGEICKVQGGNLGCYGADTAICHIYGDPHYTTFDGKLYHFQGACNYTVTETCGNTSVQFSVTSRNEHRGSPSWTVVNSVSVRLENLHIALRKNRDVYVDGVRVELPVEPTASFKECHWHIPPQLYFESCVYDHCVTGGDSVQMCNTLESYASACEAAGVVLGDWRQQSGCTEKSGYYIYIEGNDGRAGDRAQLVSAPCAERGARCMRFWYHMYGVARHMALNVYQVESGTAVLKWSDSGNKGNRWIEGQVSLHLSGDSQILLEAVRGNDYRSDVAVDDISFHVGCCEETSCTVQGDPHYMTFDDQAHDFMGTCTYTLSKLCSTSSGLPYFNVEAANEHRGRNPYVSYVRQVNVEVSSHRITLGKGRVVKVDGEEAVLPVSVSPGVVVALTGQYVVITTSFGLRVKFNGKHRAEVTLSSLFKGKVCGMCGNYNEDRRDDFLNPDGIMEPDSVSLGNSWQSGNDTRCTPDVGIRPDCSEDEKRIIESKYYCGIIKDADGPFKGCHSKVDPEAYFADCVYDLCALGTEQEALCSSLESYGDACQSEGARVEAWRNETFCPVNCGANSHYEQCGSACPATCVSPSAPSRCLKPCVEGCVCDSGYLLYNDRCVPEEKCGCWYEGKHYPVGSELWTDDTCSRKCRCPSAGSKMVCWDSTCSKDSYCGVVNGVPGCYPYTYGICRVHNDPHYNTFDKATLHFMGSCTYTIAKSCGNSSSLPYFNIETKNENRGDARVSYVQKVHVTVHGHSVWIVKGESQRVLVDDVWETLPVQRGKGALSVSRSGRYVVLTTDFGLHVSYDTDHSVEVKVPSTYFNQVCGMCGNYNGIWQDDYMKPDGSQAKDVNELGNSWKVPPDEPGCDPIEPGVCLPADEERYRGDDFCGLITSQQGPFVNCHSVINTNGFFESCVVEMCLTDGDQGALCRTLQIYSDACQRAGVTIVPWRNSTFCGIVCAANSHYNVCASACPATCTDRFASENCSKPCVEDCECNHGFVLSGSLCVSVENCGCTHKNKYYEKGAMFWEDGCREKCRCTGNDRIVCEPANCGPGEICKVQGGNLGCYGADTAICHIYGDPHYTTFDGKLYHFQGACNYTVTETCGNTSVQFSVTSRNEHRGSPSWTVVNSVSVRLENLHIALRKNRDVYVDGVRVELPVEPTASFKECHWHIPPQLYFESCVYDHCVTGGDSVQMCNTLESYASACEAAGVVLGDWRQQSGCTEKSGYYIYIEGNDGQAGDRAQLVSAPCAERGARCMRFWYHMYGVARHMALNVYQVESGTAVLKWSDSGNKGNRWIEGQVSLHLSGDSQILLEAVRGNDYRSDVAVDDISFHVGCCEETSCIVQGDPHYMTFDDQAHDFMGTCTYTLSKLCSTSSGLPYFNVEAANEHRGRNPYVSYVRQVNVEVSSHRITLGKGRVVKVDGEEAVLPVSVSPGVVVALTGQYVVITTSFGLRVKFNGKHRAEVTLSSLFKGKVCGMCGNYNEDRRDDFLNPDGIMEPDSVSLGNSWQSGNDTRCTPDVGIRPDCSEDEKRIIESQYYCGIIKDADGPFKGCHSKVDPEAYFADCVYDLCALGTEQEALCSSLESYGDACQSEGARVEAWRNETFCPVNCGANSHYEQCGSACPATCVSPSAPSRCLKPCVEGCVCDSGYLLYNDRCVPEEKCGCWYEGKHYPVGSELWTDDTCSRKCRCPSAGSKMVCWDSTCSKDSYCGVVNGVPGCYPYTYGICRVHNDPHYNTFDKATLHFMGSCTYTIAKSCGNSSSLPYFNIETKNENRGDARVSYVQKVHVTVHGHSVWIVKGESQRVLVDDVWETLPVQRGKGALSVSRSGRYVVLTTDFGLHVSYDTDHSVEVKVPSTYFNQVCGMCGNYNGIWQDDYMKPDGSQAKDVNELGNSWKVPPDEPGCDPIEPGVCLPADEERYRGDDFCGLITSQQGPFVNCHSVINTNGFFESCVVEMCLTDGDQGALCRTLQIYSDACQRAGVTIVPWRNSTFCGIVCAANSHYNVCASACPATCTDRFASENCSKPCVEDCECNHGFVLSGSLCVSVENCGCTHKNKYYEKGAMFWEDGCREKCRCTGNDRIVCEPANCGPGEICKVQGGNLGCYGADTAICHIYGDPHYTTFDGKLYHFQGACNYTVTETCGNTSVQFSVTSRNEHRGSPSWTVVNSVSVRLENLHIALRKNRDVYVDGVRVELPVEPTASFKECHWHIPPQLYFESCVYDHCVTGGDSVQMCNTLESYASACEAAGVVLGDWRQQSGCTEKSGYYIYIEGNDGRAGDRAQLVSSPCAERGARCMRFWYHMYGVARHMALNVYQVESGTAVLKWSDSGNKGNRWIEGQVSLHLSGDSQILLEAVRGNDYRSDVAVDDISFHVGCCEETSCIVQGDPHYMTFDDQAHDFMGTCTYTLSKLCSTSSGLPYFNVEAANEHRGRNPYVSYVRQVNVEVSSHRITLGKGRVVKVDGEEAVLPVSVSPGVVVALTGQYVVITTSFGLRVKFNGKHRAEVTLSSLFKGKVCGMCGNYNEDRRDDFLNPDGIMEPDSVSLGNSWQSGNDTRCTPDVGIRPDCSEDEKRIIESQYYCGIIKDADGPFKGCHSKVDPEAYFADCVYDLCALGTEQEALCSSLESYGDACQSEGARVEAWRNETFCPVNCGANSHYEQCGSACPATCVSPSAPSRCLKPCVEGCVCDSGYLLYNDRCVPEEKCGCWYEGKHYPVGSELWTDDTCSRKCRCPSAGSKMVCWDSTCSKDSYCGVVNGVPGCYPYTYGICRVHNDPHYNTFDKATLHFMGSCTYTIAKSCGNSSSLPYFNIETKNENRGDARVSYVQKVHVTVHGHSVWIVKGESQRVLVDDVWETLPVQRGKGALSVSRSGRYVVLTTDFGLHVSYDTDHSVEVKVPSTYFNQVCGMCGNYNGIWQDDYMKPDGSQAKDVNELGNSWKVPPDEPGCDPIEPGVCLPADEERYRGDDFCGLITSQQGPFVNCHSVINTNGFFESCVVEMCLTDGDQGALCRTLQIYSDACQRAGVTIVPWRNSTFCGIVCAANSHYNVCASACPATCTDRFASENCSKPCVEDCECNHGFVLSGSLCVSVENCGCTHKNKYYEKGAMFWEDGCREKCRCTGNDRIVCEPANCGPGEICKVQGGNLGCYGADTAICHIYGDPHYTTFDGKLYHFQGACNYTVTETCGNTSVQFSVTSRNEHRGSPSWTVVNSVSVRLENLHIALRKNKDVYVSIIYLKEYNFQH
ncbi:IgGFc-binding protein-like [Mobula birostris]|uniref:IgGFc-binding protein-like n=1 Tax=Mobula birostris TaxID=1983395 RepID=UPI003B2814C2